MLLQKANPGGAKPIITIPSTPESLTGIDTQPKKCEHDQDHWRELDGGIINIFLSRNDITLAKKCLEMTKPLEAFTSINVGIKPYQVGKGTPPQLEKIVETRPFDSETKETQKHRLYLRGADINRYRINPLESRFIKYGPWLAEPRPAANFDASEKIVMRQTGDSLIAAADNMQYLCLNNMHVIVPKSESPNMAYLLGILNSKLMNWYYQTLNPEVGEALAEVKKTNVAALPIRWDEDLSQNQKMSHLKITKAVQSMAMLQDQLAKAKSVREQIQRQIAAIDKQIDALVYELYQLTPEEIQLVEAASLE